MSGMPLTTRIDANLGYVCNNNCLFCYFRNRKQKRRNISTAEAKRLFSFIKRLGLDTLEITGGETTLREDIVDLISYAKKTLGFKKISIITNGTKFCDENFAAQAIDSGIDDVLVSVHGHNAALHDTLVDRTGSFAEAVKTVQNVLRLGTSCRTNTVVTKFNYNKLSDIAKMVSDLGVREVNYIFFSPLDDAIGADDSLWLNYAEAAPYVKEMIDIYNDKLKSISVKVIPFCFLEGYEKYITDFFQNIYDPCEWDYYHRIRIRRNWFICNIAAVAGLILFMDIKRMLDIGMQKSLREGILRVEAYRHCVKPKGCKDCKFDLICPGIWKRYARHFGLNEVNPARGKKIVDMDYYLH